MTNEPRTDSVQDGAKAKEKIPGSTDLDALASRARTSEDREAYCSVAGSGHFRIGLVAVATPDDSIEFRIEVLLQILAKETQPRVADLQRMNMILEKLVKRGYSLDHHDSCWISCEREVEAGNIKKECHAVMAAMQ